jgi:hypothetical protein
MTKEEKFKQRRIKRKSHGIDMRHMRRLQAKCETDGKSEAIGAVWCFILLMLKSGTDPGWIVRHAMAMPSLT